MSVEAAALEAIETLRRSTTQVQALALEVKSLKESGESISRANQNLQATIDGVTERQNKLDLELAKATALRASHQASAVSAVEGDMKRAFATSMLDTKAATNGGGGMVEGINFLSREAVIEVDGRRVTWEAEGLLNSTKTYGPIHQEMKNLFEAGMYFTATKMGSVSTIQDGIDAFKRYAPSAIVRIGALAKQAGLISDPAHVFKIFGNTSSTGGDWIPSAVFLPELEMAVNLTMRESLAGDFATKTLNAKNNKNPVLTDLPVPFLAGESNANTAADYLTSTPGTTVLSWAPKLFACAVVVDGDASFDSILDNLSEIRAAIARAMVLGFDDVIMNGDTNATHQDYLNTFNPAGLFGLTGAGGTLDRRRAAIGLRARSMDIGTAAKVDGGTFAIGLFGTALSKLNDGIAASDRNAFYCSNGVWFKKIAVLDNVVDASKYGSAITVQRGEAGRILGVPVKRTWTLAASGSNTGAFANTGLYVSGANAYESIVLAATERFKIGMRRGMTMVDSENPLNGTRTVIGKNYMDFRSLDTGTQVNVVNIYNVSA